MTDMETASIEGIRERVQTLLNREPGPLETEIFRRLWSEDCSGKYSKNLLSELVSENSRLPKDNPDILDIGDNYQLMFSVSDSRDKTERYFAEHGARSVAAMAMVSGGDKEDVARLVEPAALNTYAAGIPMLKIHHARIGQKNPFIKITSLGLSRNRKTLQTTLNTPGAEIWWLYSEIKADQDEREIRQIRLNDMMIAISAHPWVLAACRVSRSGILCSLTELIGEERMGIMLDSEFWGQKPADFLMSADPGGFLLCFRRTFEREVKECINRYDAAFTPVGRSTDDGKMTLVSRDEETAEIPFELLARYNGEPVGHNESERVLEVKNKKNIKDFSIPEPHDLNDVVKKLIRSPNIYFPGIYNGLADSTIRGNTLKIKTEQPVIRLKGSKKLVSVSMSVVEYEHERDAHTAAYNAVVRVSRQLACLGSEVLGISAAFSEGNPDTSDHYFHFLDGVRGVASAAKALKLPVLSAEVQWNVPSWNSSPVVAATGLLENKKQLVEPGFKNDGDFICILGSFRGEIEFSEYAKIYHGVHKGRLVPADGDFVSQLNMALMQAARENVIKSAIDMETGGLCSALIKSAILNESSPMGCEIYTMRKMRDDALIFGESNSTVLITIEEHKLMDMERIANDFGVACTTVGRVRDHGKLIINDLINLEIEDLKRIRMES